MAKNTVLKIGLIQTSASKDTEANLNKALAKIRIAAKNGAKIVCLPELFRTLYFPQNKKTKLPGLYDSIPGDTTRKLSAAAKRLKIILIAPIFEKAKNGKFYNSALIIGDNGKLLSTYRKIHIPHDPLFYEKSYFSEGDAGYKIYKTKFGSFAVLICYDQWFPEAARMAALGGADIIFYPTAIGNIVGYKSPDGDWHDAWETIQRGHAIANGVYIAAVNRVGREGKLQFWGQSFVSDSFGKVIKRAGKTRDEVLVASVDLSKNKKIRDGWGFFRNRRPDTYNLNRKF